MRGGAFLNGKEGRVGFRKMPPYIIITHPRDYQVHWMKERYNDTDSCNALKPIAILSEYTFSYESCRKQETSREIAFTGMRLLPHSI